MLKIMHRCVLSTGVEIELNASRLLTDNELLELARRLAYPSWLTEKSKRSQK